MLNLVGLVHTHKVIGWCKEGKVAADGFQERIDTAHIKAAALKLGSRAALQATARTRQDKGQLWVLLLIIRVFCQEARAAALLLTTHCLLLTAHYCYLLLTTHYLLLTTYYLLLLLPLPSTCTSSASRSASPVASSRWSTRRSRCTRSTSRGLTIAKPSYGVGSPLLALAHGRYYDSVGEQMVDLGEVAEGGGDVSKLSKSRVRSFPTLA